MARTLRSLHCRRSTRLPAQHVCDGQGDGHEHRGDSRRAHSKSRRTLTIGVTPSPTTEKRSSADPNDFNKGLSRYKLASLVGFMPANGT
jgi:hypothetical protein